MQAPNGVIDILVEDEVEATKVAKKYLGYFQGSMLEWQAPDPHALRHVVPENRLEFTMFTRQLTGSADEGSSLELRAQFAPGMVTIFARVEGRPVGYWPTIPCIWQALSTAHVPTRPPGLSACVTRLTYRSSA